jgi:hypothetical protein
VWDEGMWGGIRVPEGRVFANCSFMFDSNRAFTPSQRAFKWPVGFFFGQLDDAVTKHMGGGFINCHFINQAPLAQGGGPSSTPKQMTVAMCVSVDGFKVESCETFGHNSQETNTRKLMFGFRFFNCKDIRINNNYWRGIQGAGVFEFCDGVEFIGNAMRNCRTGLDLDKRCSRFVIGGNTVKYDELELSDKDAIFEINGGEWITLYGNEVENQQRYLIANNKNDVYLDWARVLLQSEDPADRSYTVSNHIFSFGNTAKNTRLSAVQLGSSWSAETYTDPESGDDISEVTTHNNVMCGDDFYIDDVYENCFVWGGQSNTHAIITIFENTGIRFGPNFRINGGGAGPVPVGSVYTPGCHGVYMQSVTTIDANTATADTYSNLRVDAFGGKIENVPWYGVFAKFPQKIHFSDLLVRNCGNNWTGTKKQMMIATPEQRTAQIDGRLSVINDGGATIDEGVQLYSQTHRTGTWRCIVWAWKIQGHVLDLQCEFTTGGEGVGASCLQYYPQPLFPQLWPQKRGVYDTFSCNVPRSGWVDAQVHRVPCDPGSCLLPLPDPAEPRDDPLYNVQGPDRGDSDLSNR